MIGTTEYTSDCASDCAPHHASEPPTPLHTSSQDFVFSDVPEEPLPSLLRGFSAPVKLVQPLTDAQLAFLAANDNDPFNRWDALQRLYQKALLEQVR